MVGIRFSSLKGATPTNHEDDTMATQNITIAPARTERRIFLTINGAKAHTYAAEFLDDAKATARKLRDGGVSDVKLTWKTVEHEAKVMTPLQYAYMLEGLHQDEATYDDYLDWVAEHGEPDFDLIAQDQKARRRAGVCAWGAWPAHLDPVDFGGVAA